jgi:hypothetical protein
LDDNSFGIKIAAGLSTGLYSSGSVENSLFVLKGSLENEPERTFEFTILHFNPALKTTYKGKWDWIDSQLDIIEMRGTWETTKQLFGVFSLSGSIKVEKFMDILAHKNLEHNIGINYLTLTHEDYDKQKEDRLLQDQQQLK